MQRSSTSSSQNVHTQQPFFASRRRGAMTFNVHQVPAQRRQGNPVRQHLEEVASKLAAVAVRKRLCQQTGGNAEERWRLQGMQRRSFAKLEAASRAMPVDDEDLAIERAEMAARIVETKSGMAENKFFGARMDAARGRLTRAQQRAKEAADALEMAQRAVAESDVEIACIERELRDLEAALGHAPAVLAPGSSLRMSRKRCSCPLTASTVLSSPIVDRKLVSMATAQSAELIAGFQHAFTEVERQRGLQADPPKRLCGKQPQRVRPRMTVRTRTLKRRVEETRVAMSDEIPDL